MSEIFKEDIENFYPHDIILTKDNVLCVIKAVIKGDLIVHPKYIPDKEGTYRMLEKIWTRISNPLDPKRNNSFKRSKYLMSYGKRDFILDIRGIKKYFSTFSETKEILDYKGDDLHKREVKKLILVLLQKIPLKDLGIAGSTLIGGQTYGFSDIDIVIKQEDRDNFSTLKDIIFNEKFRGIKTRTLQEWEEFYEHYNVISSLNKKEFAAHMVKKPDQFVFDEIPVSIFFVSKNQPFINPEDIPSGNANFNKLMIIKKDDKSMFLPGEYTAETKDGKIFQIFAENRSFISQAQKGDLVLVKGFLNKANVIFLRNNKEDFMRKWKND